MNELIVKEKTAIERLKAFEPEDGYYLAYSGGKDSDCIKILAQLANVKYNAVHNLTTVDAPETIQYIRSQGDIEIERQHYADGTPKTMWNLIVKKCIPPLRIARYCCSELKESGGNGKVTVTGVRWYESSRRKESADIVKVIGKPKTTQKLADEIGVDYKVTKQGGIIMNDDNAASRRMVELCYRTRKTLINPIVDWTDSEVWEFLHHYGCDGNPLYGCGFKRIGCIGCPMAGVAMRKAEFERYPTYKTAYIHAFDRMLENRVNLGMTVYMQGQTGADVFDRWISK